MSQQLTRRLAMQSFTMGGLVAMAASKGTEAAEAAESAAPLKGNIKHSVCRWCYGRIPLDDLCKAAKAIGIESIDLQGPKEWPILRKYALTCAMGNGAGMGITKGFNRVELHDRLVADYATLIPQAAAADIPNVICFSGNRGEMDDETGLKNCAQGIKRLMKLAEQQRVTLVMELLNSKVDHEDYMCDHTDWGAQLCQLVGSERFKLLYDIYHMQIMEGDLIRTIKNNAPYIAHYHTGGNPGRNEIDETQEIYYPAVMKAIVDTGYKGFIAQEFAPRSGDPLGSLRAAVQICDV
jgi:hydroxypyruvate isomerase